LPSSPFRSFRFEDHVWILNRKADIKVEGVPATANEAELCAFSDIISTFRVYPDLEMFQSDLPTVERL
jgi:hypothetical protein